MLDFLLPNVLACAATTTPARVAIDAPMLGSKDEPQREGHHD